jgi:hypothetical protein
VVPRILTANPKKRRLTRTRMPRDRNTCDSVGSGVVVRTLVVVVVASVVFNVERSVVAVVLSDVVSTVVVAVVDVVVFNAVVTAAAAARPTVLTTCSKGTRGGIAAILNVMYAVPMYAKYTLSRRSEGFDVCN